MGRGLKALISVQIIAVLVFLFFVVPQITSERPIDYVIQPQQSQENRPTIRVGDDFNYPPYTFLDKDGNPTGYNIELIQAVADVIGYNLELELMSWSEVRKGLENGSLDLTAGMFYTDARAEDYAFSSRHSLTWGDIFTRNGDQIKTLDELQGKTVVVLRDDIMEEYLSDQDLNIQLIQVDTIPDAFGLVHQGIYDYAGIIKPIGMYLIDEYNYENLVASDLALAPHDYCMAASKENEELIYLMNSGMQVLKANGTYQMIYDRWLGIYEERDWGAFLQDNLIMILPILLMIVFLIESVIILRVVLRKKSRELERSYASKFAAEAKTRTLLRAVPDMIFHVNVDGKILDYSETNPNLKALAAEGDLFSSIESILGLDQTESIMKDVQRVVQTGQMMTDYLDLQWKEELYHFEFRIIRLNEKEAMLMVRDITQRQRNETKIRYLNEHDQLTDLHNRRFFEKELDWLSSRGICPVSVMMIDVNGLKLVNDSFGHAMGDQLLRKVASALQRTCQDKGSVSRTGGDEFVVLLPLIAYEEARQIAKQIKKNLADEKVAFLEISVSIGWATKTIPSENLREVLVKAEDFMYKEKLLDAPGMHGEAIQTIMRTLYEKSSREEAHSQRVSLLSYQLAVELGLPEKDCQELKAVSLLHDIGKIAIPVGILDKPGKLTDDEFEQIKKHPEIGFRILGSIHSMAELAQHVLSHHERWDGRGYPRGLKEEEIPLMSRIIAIADAYDAMTSERSYKKAMTKWQAIEEIKKNMGSQFDPLIADAFISQVLQGKEEMDA